MPVPHDRSRRCLQVTRWRRPPPLPGEQGNRPPRPRAAMAEQLRPVYEGKFTDRFPELSAVSAFAQGVPPLPPARSLRLFAAGGSHWAGGKRLQEAQLVGLVGAPRCGHLSLPSKMRVALVFFPHLSKRGQLHNISCKVSDPNLTSCAC